jgi:hypothetical protein
VVFIPANALVRVGSAASGKVLDANEARVGDPWSRSICARLRWLRLRLRVRP